MSLKPSTLVSSNTPDLFRVIEEIFTGARKKKNDDINAALQEIFIIAAERGLNEDEFSLMIKFFYKGSINLHDKMKLLPSLTPSTIAPTPAMRDFLFWFFSNYHKKFNKQYTVNVLQWIIGLLDNDLVEPSVVDIFYYDLYTMLHYNDLVKYVCKLLCKLTKPYDVTTSVINVVFQKQQNDGGTDDKYLFAVLNLFKGYKPHLISEGVLMVDVNKVLRTVPQKMDSLMRLVKRRHQKLETRCLGIVEAATVHNYIKPEEALNKISSLVPLPTYSLEGLDKAVACHPQSIEEALMKFSRVPIPQNVISLLRSSTGFFLLMFRGIELQNHFSVVLLRNLQDVFINQELTATEDDKEHLLHQIYQLEMFMQQGVPCVSTFLSGYLLNWDGLDHRSTILKLVEWASFDSFQDLSGNILRPLYLLFVSYNTTMKKQIIETATNLIKNMIIADIGRVRRDVSHPFLSRPPAWTSKPMDMFDPLVEWAEQLIKVGLCQEPTSKSLLMESLRFYEVMNMLEKRSNLPMWTVLSRGVVYHSLFNVTPVVLNRVCRLLLKYHKEFLTKLRAQQPDFYKQCINKISLTSKYAQELINFLWNGQAVSRKEDGVIFKEIPEQSLQQFKCVDLDTTFDLSHNVTFLPYIIHERNKNGPGFLNTKEDYFTMIEYYLEDISDFIKHFSQPCQSP